MLGHCKPDHVLVLHILGTNEDILSAVASRECLEIVRSMCQYLIYLHCFSGGGAQKYREWRAAFQDCYVGFTGKVVEHFNRAQGEALLRVRRKQLLLGTDAPYIPPNRFRSYERHIQLILMMLLQM